MSAFHGPALAEAHQLVGQMPSLLWAEDASGLEPWRVVTLGVSRVVSYLGFVLLVGTSLFVTWLWPEGRVLKPFRVLLWTGALLTLLTALSTVVLAVGRIGTDTFDGRVGALSLARAALVCLGVAFAHDVLSSTKSHPFLISTWHLAVVLTYVLASDAWGGPWSTLKIVASTLHLLATAAWLGGLLCLASVLVPRESLDALNMVLPRFSLLAIASVVTLVVSGSMHALAVAGSLRVLATTAYGQALLVKLAVFGTMLLLGNIGRRYAARVGHRPVTSIDDTAPAASITAFAMAVGAEFALALGVLVATAGVVHFAPGP